MKKLIKDLIYPLVKSPPDFLIIGAQKAGTTSLYNYLVQHPQIIGNKTWKEVRYFDVPENYSQGWSWYLGCFPSKIEKGNRLTFDVSPSYLYFPEIPQRIKEALGTIKMIVILRNPVDRAYSAWKMYHSFANNPEVAENNKKIADERTFTQAIHQELNNECAPDIYPYDYINRGKYVEQLNNYYQYFDKNNLLILSFEELKNNKRALLNKICEFLEIEPFPDAILQQLEKKSYNVGKGVEITAEHREVLEKLKNYFIPFNEKLYELLNNSYHW
ncbi:sulfotransferase domain-containing protein [Cyanothece sp. BG0011]|uniref:sulfotransferase domain-containing protein n=1 Tax=Cyanothece sp. BG0011 TaxID=2082950 RepID=UPI000D1E5769|nr:sulfotransferase domain-containing protein [Cyanothece sp. BG0011]